MLLQGTAHEQDELTHIGLLPNWLSKVVLTGKESVENPITGITPVLVNGHRQLYTNLEHGRQQRIVTWRAEICTQHASRQTRTLTHTWLK